MSEAQRRKNSLRIRKMTYAALFLAIALVLPFITGQIPEIGAMLSPMHIPVLLCGFACGWPWGLAVGLIAPLLRSVLFGMPALFPTAVIMTFELGTYGLVSGWLYQLLPEIKAKGKTKLSQQSGRYKESLPNQHFFKIYIVLVIAMILGRLVYVMVRLVLLGLSGNEFTLTLFLADAFASVFTKAVPGIILHLVLIPPLVLAMERAGLSMNG